jgi:hypothetical protein
MEKTLTESRRTHGNLQHILIAHSHAGNLVLYAVRGLSAEIRRSIKAIVCIGTPFINCRLRDIRVQKMRLLASALGGTVLWVAACSYSRFPKSVRVVAGILAVVGVVGFLRLVQVLRSETLMGFAEVHADRVHADPPEGIPMLCISARLDEAQIWLDAVSTACRTLTWLWERAFDVLVRWTIGSCRAAWDLLKERAQDWWAEKTQEMGTGCFVALLIVSSPMLVPLLFVMLIFFGGYVALFPTIWFGVIAGWVIAISALVGFMFAHVIALASLLTRAGPWGFGEHWLFNWLVDVRAGQTPWPRKAPSDHPFSSNIRSLMSYASDALPSGTEVRAVRLRGWTSLRHVNLCSDPSVVAMIVDWISKI